MGSEANMVAGTAGRTLKLAVAALLMLAIGGGSMAGPDSAVAAAHLRWLAAGDSYSSGEGLPHSTGPCAQATPGSGSEAWAFAAWRDIGGNGSAFNSPALTACTGEKTSQFFSGTYGAEWYPSSGRWNLVTFTLGGDDVGFASFLTSCELSDCPSKTRAAIAAKLGQSYRDFLRKVANNVVTPGGDMVVLGYPELIADPSTWTGLPRLTGVCQGLARSDAYEIRGLAGDLNATIGADVHAVNAEHPNGVHLTFVDVESGGSAGISQSDANLFEPAGRAGHLLCGPDSWINGFTHIDLKGIHPNGSFHPKQAGEEAMGALAAEAIRHIRAGANGGATGGGNGTTSAPPSGSGGPTGPTPGGSPSPGPARTYSETTGGVAHTWSDPSDAGGVEGPSIASNQTVEIACWVSGFRVADGNTYWYRVASSPWSNAYYVSADAFYNNGETSGTLSGTPFVDPAVPNCSSGSGGGGGSKPTYAETTGGVAHTWTNPSNAGGVQGPSIASRQTVQIACWVTGFRVADGNTYWYLIASSPWNDGYYVSADAFYNDGATSGPLAGTPFVDPSVPNCSNTGGGSTGGAKPTYAETTGGVAHTWTNYSNAGGTQGPSIASQQTVQITCWVSGFRVADGNTYWYRIASAPWNNAYYVSADAFYNNGATSGSLIGTPFVDPAVPAC